MNLYQLKVFYYAAKYENLSKAAEALYITQPAVTKQIQQLQNYYGIRLLNRFGKRMVLTDAGKIIFGIAEKILELEKRAEESIRDFQQLKSGEINIISSETFGAYYLPFIIIDFNRDFPDIQVRSNILPVDEVYSNVLSLNCDIGFVSYKIDEPRVMAKKIIDDSIVLIVPENHKFSKKECFYPEDIMGQPVIMHERGSATRKIIDNYLRKHNVNIKVIFEFSNNESIKRSVESGIGISFVSKNTAIEEIKSGKLVAIPPSDKSLKRSFFLIYHRDKYFSKHLKGFLNTIDRWIENFNSSQNV